MQFILIRHAAREHARGVEDRKQRLDEAKAKEIAVLKRALSKLGVTPTVCLTSSYVHAKHTAARLLEELKATHVVPQELESLTPGSKKDGILDFLDEVFATALTSNAVVLVVSHEPRLSQLLSRMTKHRPPPLTHAGAVCVEADSQGALLAGAGEVKWRWPEEGTRSQDLAAKLTSKMQVSGILAGLTVAAVAVILADRSPSVWQIAAASLLTGSAALFVASLYAYDRLTMPDIFWGAAESGGGKKWIGGKDFVDDRNANGILHAEMVWQWKWVFSPALILGALGYLAMIANMHAPNSHTGCGSLPNIVCDRPALLIATLFVILLTAFYQLSKPRLGVD